MRINQIIEVKQELHSGVGVFRGGEIIGLFALGSQLQQALDDYDAVGIGDCLLGAMDWFEEDGYNSVGSAYAQRGWGPALYECVMSIAPLKPAPSKVTPAARQVWNRMAERSDVRQLENGAMELITPINLRQYEQNLKKITGQDPYGERRALLHEALESTLSNTMRDIYQS